MPTIREEYARRRKLISSASWDEISERVRAIMAWMLSVPNIASVVDGLERTVNIDDMLRRKQDHMPPPTGTVEEVARLGVYILRQVHGGHDFAAFGLGLSIQTPYVTDGPSITHEMRTRYVNPALDYIDDELRALESGATPEAVLKERMSLLFGHKFAQMFPITANRLQKASAEISEADSATQWSSVANSCRQCLLEFIGELRRQRALPATTLKDDDFKGHAKAILTAVRKDVDDSSARLERLVAASWDYAQAVTHKRPADRVHAQIVFTWTALSILELWRATTPRS